MTVATTIEIAAFEWVPPFAQGHVKDLRVRWALEEAGLPYRAVLIDHEEKSGAAYRAWQPFGQVPAFREGPLEMFESGAILLHLAERSDALAPRDPAGRARVKSWVLAALNSVEPGVAALAEIDIFHRGEAWTRERRPQVVEALQRRLAALAAALGEREHLEGRFTAGDLTMTTVLRALEGTGVLEDFPTLERYRRRHVARPAFARALEAQLADFRAHAPAA